MPLLGGAALVSITATPARGDDAWWNKAWTQRQKITLDTEAAALTDPAGDATVLVRLSDGNFQASPARDDGSDLRFVAADGQTVLPHQIEGFDSMLNEAFVWVKLAGVKPAAKQTFYMYFANRETAMPASAKPSDAWDADTVLVYHFNERTGAPTDSTANANNAQGTGAAAGGSLISNGLRLLGAAPITIPNSKSLEWKAGQPLTLALWIKPSALQANAIIVARADGNSAFKLLLDQGVPAIEIGAGANPVRSQPGAPLAAGAWCHLAVVADGKTARLFVNGQAYASVDAVLPALTTPLTLGGLANESANASAFTGDLDELSIASTARSAGWVKLTAVNQGAGDAAQHALVVGPLEGGSTKEPSKFLEHLSLFHDIAGNMMFDGWIAVGICLVMIVVGWSVAVRKFIYLNSIEAATKLFLKQWKSLSTDLTALDHDDHSSVSSLGGTMDEDEQDLIAKSPMFHIYQIGSEEIRHRLEKDNTRVQGLSGRSIQAIRASLDAGMVHESHRLSDGLVYLTISVAGGPYVGLLGPVVGVMITFAIIARSGEVNVNSIAPGIASALLATVVGLIVAIPALFIYSYLNSRIKNALSLMQVFIDEFVAKMAEFYRPPQEPDQPNARH